jgi:hypothetical protein
MINTSLIGVVIVVIIVIIFVYEKYYSKSSTEKMDKYDVSKYKHRSWYTLNKPIVNSIKPYEKNNVSCMECDQTSGNCDHRVNEAKDMIQSQRDKMLKKRTGGSGLYNKIKKGNNLPEKQMSANITSASATYGATDNDPGDFTNYMTKISINPDIIHSHNNYIAESKMFSQQPAIPSDVIESNYGNWWGLGRRAFKGPSPDALLQYGANDEDYDTSWSMKFG